MFFTRTNYEERSDKISFIYDRLTIYKGITLGFSFIFLILISFLTVINEILGIFFLLVIIWSAIIFYSGLKNLFILVWIALGFLLMANTIFLNFAPVLIGIFTKEVLIFSCLIGLILSRAESSNIRGKLPNHYKSLYALLIYSIILTILTFIRDGSVENAFWGFRSLTLYSFMYFVGLYAIRSYKDILKFKTFLTIVGIISAIITIIEFIWPEEVLSLMGYSYGDQAWRTAQAGFLKSPGLMTDSPTSMLLAGIAFWLLLAQPKSKLASIANSLTALILSVGVLLTGSRSTYVGIVAAVLLLIFLNRITKKGQNKGQNAFITIFIIVGAGAIIVNTFTNGILTDIGLSIFGQGSSTLSINSTISRFDIYQSELEDFLGSPIIGTGLRVATENTKVGAALDVNYSHSYWIKILTQTGIIGLFLFVCFLVIIFSPIIKNINILDTKFRVHILGIFVFICIILVANFTLDSMESPPINVLFWVLCGSLSRILTLSLESERKELSQKS